MLSIGSKNTSNFQLKTLKLVHNFHNLLLFSTSQTSTVEKTQSLPSYLVNSLGFTHEQALSTSNKVKKFKSHFKFSSNSNCVVNFLEKHGFDDTHIRKIVSSHPRILSSKVDKTLEPKFQFFKDLGISSFDLVRIVSSNPSLLTKHFNHIIPDLRIILGSHENLVKFFMKSTCFATSSTFEDLVSNVKLLEDDYGVSIDIIRNHILWEPGMFLRKPEFFRSMVVKVVEEIRVTPDVGMFLHVLSLFCNSSEKTIESKRQLFKSFGWTYCNVSELIRKCPFAIHTSEENIRKKLEFFMKELGYKPDFLASHPALFTYSLEKRVVPRYRVLQVLKEKGLVDNKLYSAVTKTEARFLKTCVEPFREDIPDLLELYGKSKGCREVGHSAAGY